MTNIRPFKIDVPQSDIDELNTKLLGSRFPGVAEDSWERGTPIQDIKHISEHWRENFSWRSFEERLNRLPHYEATVAVDGFDPVQVHFIHQQSSAPDAIPLLFVHGCMSDFALQKGLLLTKRL